MPHTRIVPAVEQDTPVILSLIRALADYEKLSHRVTATEEQLRRTLFGAKPAAEVVLAYHAEECAGFALFFASYSTFLAQPGLYLEDLYVESHLRGRGIGSELLKHLARLASQRGYGRMEWDVLDWNLPAIRLYRKIGAVPMDQWTKYRLTGEALERLSGHLPDTK